MVHGDAPQTLILGDRGSGVFWLDGIFFRQYHPPAGWRQLLTAKRRKGEYITVERSEIELAVALKLA